MNGLKRTGLVLLTVLVMAAMAIAVDFFRASALKAASVKDRAASAQGLAKAGSVLPEPAFKAGSRPVRLELAEIQDTASLLLVGPEYPSVSAEPPLTPVGPDGQKVRPDIRPAVAAFLAEAEERGMAIGISSAYRDGAEQARLYDSIKDPTLVQPPGHSEHQTGLALDLQPDAGSAAPFAETVAFLEEQAPRFGFIQRYPPGREAVTGIQHEYWHYRYVGEPHATFMAQHGLALEEYLELLQYKGQLDIQGARECYRIYWKEPVDGEIRFYSGRAYEISSTNTGAFIVTVTGEESE